MTTILYTIFRGIIGSVIIIGLAYLFSNNRKKVSLRIILWGILLQVVFAFFILQGDELRRFFLPLGFIKDMFNGLSYFFLMLINFTSEGSKFLFGSLGTSDTSIGFVFAFQVLPTIIFVACLSSVLYYLGIMQFIVKWISWLMSKLMRTSGAETVSTTADIFFGQTEAPLTVKPYIKNMTQSELFTIMTAGMTTVAVGTMLAYVQVLAVPYAQSAHIPLQQAQLFFTNHLLAASIMAAPSALMVSKVMFPETEVPETYGKVQVQYSKTGVNLIDAAANGASDGLRLALNVGGMLIAFIAIIALTNYFLQSIGYFLGINALIGTNLTMQYIFGQILRVAAYCIGVSWNDSFSIGSLLGTKTVLNEMVAYLDMSKIFGNVGLRSLLIGTYALCGFANFSSIAIQIGGTGGLVPERKSDVARLGLKVLLASSLANLLTASLAGMFINL